MDHVAPSLPSFLRCSPRAFRPPPTAISRRAAAGVGSAFLLAHTISPATTVSLRHTYLAASSCFVALVFGILWPTSSSGMYKRPNLSAYKKGAALREKKD